MVYRLSGCLVVLCLLLSSTGCESARPIAKAQRSIISKPPEEWVQTELIFNLAPLDGAPVTDGQWQRFADECSANFPEGVTILPAVGQHRETQGNTISAYRGPSRVVIIAYPKSDPLAEGKLKSICRSYLSSCNSQAPVLRIDTPVRASVTVSQEQSSTLQSEASAQ